MSTVRVTHQSQRSHYSCPSELYINVKDAWGHTSNAKAHIKAQDHMKTTHQGYRSDINTQDHIKVLKTKDPIRVTKVKDHIKITPQVQRLNQNHSSKVKIRSGSLIKAEDHIRIMY